MAEELRLQQGVRQSATVDSHEGAPLARARGVYGTGEKLLARAGLPLNKHRGVGKRHLGKNAQDFLDPRVLAYDVAKGRTLLELLPERFDDSKVTERLHPTHDLACLIPQHRGGDADGNTFAIVTYDVGGLVNVGLASLQRLAQAAVVLTYVRLETSKQ